MTGLRLQNIRIRLGEKTLVDLSADIPPGGILTVMGPSGSGKSTLLSYIIGALDPAFAAEGAVTLGGRDVAGLPVEKRRIGMLFQDAALFPHLSVGGNLAFALPPGVKGRAARRAAIDSALTDAGLGGYADHDPATLSGGQRQRVALMRALLSAPEALLLDEPFSKLDADLRAEMRAFVFDHARARGLPVVLVTHDAADAHAAGGPVMGPMGGLRP